HLRQARRAQPPRGGRVRGQVSVALVRRVFSGERRDVMNPWVILLAVVVLAVVFVVVPVGAVTFAHWRRPVRLTCPRAGTEAQIKVAETRAAVAEVLGRRAPGIERCSLWPALRGCREACHALPAGELRRMR